MAHTFTNILVHVIFSTKDRYPLLTPEIRSKLYPYLAGIVANCDGVALASNGPADHIHMLLSLPTTKSLADFVRDLKANSSKWMHEERHRPDFAWQTGYGAFSVSQSLADKVKAYIQSQEAHHRQVSFQEEFIAFLERHEITYDPRFIWE
jgi:REP element-mobilizing transposase RayT